MTNNDVSLTESNPGPVHPETAHTVIYEQNRKAEKHTGMAMLY